VRQHRAGVPGGVQFDVPDTPAEVPRCHDANVKGGVRSWIAARRSDPVPVLLTIGGCVISLVSLIFAVYSDLRGVASNVIADLILIGPALFLSNIIVKRIQDGRVRERIAPLLHVIAQLLYSAAATSRQALEMLDTEAQLGPPVAGVEQMTLSSVESALAQAITELDAATHGQPLPATLPTSQPLLFPRFGMVRRLVQQADQRYSMLLGLLLCIIFTLDHPFGTQRGITPAPFKHSLEVFDAVDRGT
jgi:hypothetical protein